MVWAIGGRGGRGGEGEGKGGKGDLQILGRMNARRAMSLRMLKTAEEMMMGDSEWHFAGISDHAPALYQQIEQKYDVERNYQVTGRWIASQTVRYHDGNCRQNHKARH